MNHYIHNIPGRLRVKTPLFKMNTLKVEEARNLLINIRGISSIDFNTITGSVLIRYDKSVIQPESILNLMKEEGYTDPQNSVTNEQYIRKIVQDAGQILVKQLFGHFVDQAFKGTPLSYVTLFL